MATTPNKRPITLLRPEYRHIDAEWYSVAYGGRGDKYGNEVTSQEWEEFTALDDAITFVRDLPQKCQWEIIANSEEGEDCDPIGCSDPEKAMWPKFTTMEI